MQRGASALRIQVVAQSDEALFERFRRHGDVAALGDLFDRLAPAVLRVAMHLVRDPAAAEDLLQGTFVRLMESRERWDGSRPLLPWLCGMLQNVARQQRWQFGRRPDPDRLRVAPPPPDPAHAAEASEFDAAIDAAISTLPELYRPVLRMHLAYGHAPAEIAHALDRPAATVRSQLARALEQLRRLLPASFAGALALALTAGRGLAATRQLVLEHAAKMFPVPLAAAGVAGGVAMKKLVGIAAAAVLLAIGAWFAVPPATKVAAPPAAGTASPVAVAPAEAPAGPTEAGTPLRTEVAGAQLGERTGSLRITCRFADDGQPARGVLVSMHPRGVIDAAMLQRAGRTDDNGVIAFPQLLPATWRLAADRGGKALAEVAAGSVRDVELVIPKGIHVRGRVLDEHAAPVAGASVWLSRGPHDYCCGCDATTSDAAGRFLLRDVEPERFVSASFPGRRSAVVQPVRSENGASIDVDLVLAGIGASLVGTVLDADGEPCADARVFVGDGKMDLRWHKQVFAEHRPPAEVLTDANGAFAVHGLAGGVTQPVWIRAPGHCAWYQRVAIPAEGDAQVQVALQRGATLSGRVSDAADHQLAGAGIDYVSTAWYPGLFFDDFRGPEWAVRGAVADADGRYRIACISPGNLRVRARSEALEGETRLTLANEENATWNPVLIERVIRGRVVDERGAAVPNVDVTAYPPRGKGNLGSATSDGDGKFACERRPDVPHVLTFHLEFPRERGGKRVHATTVFGISPSADEIVVRLPDRAFAVGTLRGRWLDTDGSPLKARVTAAAAGQRYQQYADTVSETGAFVLGPLPAGTWRVQASVETDGIFSRRSAWSEHIEVRAGEVRDVGALQMPVTGWIDVAVCGPGGEPLHGESVCLEISTGWSESPWVAGKLDHGRARIADVAPGTYQIRVGGGKDMPLHYTPVTVRAGEGTQVTVRVPKGVGVELVMPPISEAVPMHLDFVWHRDGTLFVRYDNWWEGNGERKWQQRLVPGAYELTVTSETGKRTVNHFTIADGEPDGRKIAIRLP